MFAVCTLHVRTLGMERSYTIPLYCVHYYCCIYTYAMPWPAIYMYVCHFTVSKTFCNDCLQMNIYKITFRYYSHNYKHSYCLVTDGNIPIRKTSNIRDNDCPETKSSGYRGVDRHMYASTCTYVLLLNIREPTCQTPG